MEVEILSGVSSDDEDISYDSQGRATHTDNNFTDQNGFLYTFVERLNEDAWDPDAAANCVGNNAQATSNVYNNQEVDALRNKAGKWNTIIGENRFLNAKALSKIKGWKCLIFVVGIVVLSHQQT